MSVLAWVVGVIAVAGPIPRDTVVALGTKEIDMTGDGRVEVLELVGVGESLDSLAVRLSIKSSDRTIYSRSLRPMTRTVGYDAGQRTLTLAEHRERLDEYGDYFFADQKFMTPERFLERLRNMAPGRIDQIPSVIARQTESSEDAAREIWEGLKERGNLVFEFPTGGDRAVAIIWSEANQRFYQVLDCC